MAPLEKPINYNDPPNNPGSFDQLIPFYWEKKALIDLKKSMYFSQLSATKYVPPHHGKTIKRYHWIPLLDDRNINDQGIDATGSNVADEVTITITDPSGSARYAVGNGTDPTSAETAAEARAEDIFKNINVFDTDFATTVANLTAAGWTIVVGPAVNNGGNLYGSSRDIGYIAGRLPAIDEEGTRANKVGFTRKEIVGRIENFGFFGEYTEDSVQFDNEHSILEHISRESLRAANYMNEDMLQIDLLNGAGVVYYGGDATATNELTGEVGAVPSTLDLETLTRVESVLNNNLCPKDTTIITGVRMIDTRTIAAARYAYMGSDLKLQLLKMNDFHGFAAFIPVHKYAAAGQIAVGEIGAIQNFRFIENPQMMVWEGEGAVVTNNDGYKEARGKYNVYPVLIVGDESFSTLGLQYSGGGISKFKIMHKSPGVEVMNRMNPFGKIGLFSIQWWYGTVIWRPEWIACIKVVAEK